MLSKASDRLGRCYRSIAAAGHDGLAADAKPGRHRGTIQVARFLAPARGALRPGRNLVPDHHRTQKIEADDMVLQVGAKTAGNGLGDLGRRKPDRARREHIAGQRRRCHAARMGPVEKSLDLAIPFHAIGQTGPAGALSAPENRTDQRKDARGLHQQPILPLRQPLTVEFDELAVEIVVHQNDRQIGRMIDHPNAEFAQSGVQFVLAGRCHQFDLHAGLPEVLRGGFARETEAGPVACGRLVDQVRGHHEAAIEQARDGLIDVVGREFAREHIDDGFADARPRQCGKRRRSKVHREEKSSGFPNRDRRHREAGCRPRN